MHAPRVVLVKAIVPGAAPVCVESSLVRVDEPTRAQAAAGRYPKRTMPWKGLTIRIENETGSVRRGTTPDGHQWETTMRAPYGYISRTEAVDGDECDVYLGPFLETATTVFVVHQRKAGDWKAYDEDKSMLGYLSEADAREAYLQHYDDPRFLGPITAMPVDEFVAKVRATREAPAMIKARTGEQLSLFDFGDSDVDKNPILFIKAKHRGDDRTPDMFSSPAAGTHMETITRKDGVVQRHVVANAKAEKKEPSGDYQSAMDKWRAASAEFRTATEKYRAREIGDDEYLAARKARDEAEREMDSSEAAEKKPAKKVENAKPSPFATKDDADMWAGFSHVHSNDALFSKRRKFGVAGGPDEIDLTQAGHAAALNFANQSRWNLDAKHAVALEQVHAAGVEGLQSKGLDHAIDESLRELSHQRLKDRDQESLAAGLRGDEDGYNRIRDENRIVYLDQPQDVSTFKWKLTSTGKALFDSYVAAKDAMISSRVSSKKDAALSAAVAHLKEDASQKDLPAAEKKEDAALVAKLEEARGAEPFDSEKFDRERNERIKASRESGAVHLDRLPMYVESMRGKKISYVHGDEKGTITTVTNNGAIYVRWDSGPMAGSESMITGRDAKDYVVLNPVEQYDPKKFAKEQKAAAKKAASEELEKFIKVAADSIGQLRKVDVMRVLESNGTRKKELARYISTKRPDLAQEVKEVMEDEFSIHDYMAKSLAPRVTSVRRIS